MRLENAEIQCETPEQASELSAALNDMLQLSTEELRERRYADYQGNPAQWDVITILASYILSAGRYSFHDIQPDLFYQDVQMPEAKKAIRRTLKDFERNGVRKP